MKRYSERLSRSAADAIQEFYVAPRMEADRNAFPLHIRLHKAHMTMLAQEGIVPRRAASAILRELLSVEAMGVKALPFRTDLADVYLTLQMALMERLGPDVGGWIHLAFSRNDYQMAQARLTAREQVNGNCEALLDLMGSLLDVSADHLETIMPGYTHHSQQAQPITFGHFLLASYDAFARDLQRMANAYRTTNLSPMGCAAISTTSFPVNRQTMAKFLGFGGLIENSLDATGSRDFILEVGASNAIALSNIGRLTESLLLWNTAEFGMIELADEYCDISSIMPQKKNPVTLEILRAEAVEVQNALGMAFGILKGIPPTNGRESGYAEEAILRASPKLAVLAPVLGDLIATLTVHKERMLERSREGFSTMTELADAIVKEVELSFHQAYLLVGELVARVLAEGGTAATISVELLDEVAEERLGRRLNLSTETLQAALDPVAAVESRTVIGGPAPSEARRMVDERRGQQERLREELSTRRQELTRADRAMGDAMDALLSKEEAE